MPESRLAKARATLPHGYQFGVIGVTNLSAMLVNRTTGETMSSAVPCTPNGAVCLKADYSGVAKVVWTAATGETIAWADVPNEMVAGDQYMCDGVSYGGN